MKPDLADLKITTKELERLTGIEVNSIFMGGVLGEPTDSPFFDIQNDWYRSA